VALLILVSLVVILSAAAARAVWHQSWSKTGRVPHRWPYGPRAWTFLQRASPTIALGCFLLLVGGAPQILAGDTNVIDDPAVPLWLKVGILVAAVLILIIGILSIQVGLRGKPRFLVPPWMRDTLGEFDTVNIPPVR
jgi:hypothetical protein